MYYRYATFVIAIMTILATGCKKLVEIDPPVSRLVSKSVFNSDNTVISAQLGVYATMQKVPWSLAYWSALSSDELTNLSTSQGPVDLYTNALSALQDGNNLFWQNAYGYIYQENAIIENIRQSSDGITDKTKKLQIGEAEFMRAFWYFYLVNFYGDVPLITTTDYKAN